MDRLPPARACALTGSRIRFLVGAQPQSQAALPAGLGEGSLAAFDEQTVPLPPAREAGAAVGKRGCRVWFGG